MTIVTTGDSRRIAIECGIEEAYDSLSLRANSRCGFTFEVQREMVFKKCGRTRPRDIAQDAIRVMVWRSASAPGWRTRGLSGIMLDEVNDGEHSDS